MKMLTRLRHVAESSDVEFEALALRYRRLSRDYGMVAKDALSDFALWDGTGAGSAQTFWNRALQIEQKREGVRVGVLGDLLNAVETAGDDYSVLDQAVERFCSDRGLDKRWGDVALVAEMLRRFTVRALTKLKNEVYPRQDVWDRKAGLEAQVMLRFAAELDRR